MKLAGAALVGLSAVIFGVSESKRISDCGRLRKSLILLLKEIKRGVAQGEPLGSVFASFDDGMLRRTGFLEILRTPADTPLYDALKNCKETELLTSEEKTALLSYSHRLGKCADRTEEEERASDMIRLLEEKRTSLEAPMKQRAELVLRLGVLAAAAVIIVFGL